MAIISNLIARLSVDHGAFDKGMGSSRKSLYGLTQESANANKALVGMAASAIKLAAAAGGLYAIKTALAAGYREASQFETGMAKISTMLDAGAMKSLPQFRKEIQQMSIAYGEATSSLTQGATDIIGSGIAPAKAMQVLEAATIGAKGGFTTTATVVKAVVGVLNAYQMDASSAQHVTDILAKTVQNGVISFEELAQNIGQVTGFAGVLGVDLEAVGASISTMTRAGISAEISITALRAILNAFMNPTDAAVKAAAELGFSLDETSIRGMGLVTVMDKLRGANASQLEALMPNVRGLVGFSAMLKNAAGLEKDASDMMRAAGTAQGMLDKVGDTAAFQAARATQAWSAFKVALGDVFLGDARQAMQGFADAVQNNTSKLEKMAQAARAANHPVDTLARKGIGIEGGKAMREGWTEMQAVYKSLGAEMQGSFEKSFASRDIFLPDTIKGEPKKRYKFDVAKMPIPSDYGSSAFSTVPSLAAKSDVAYAERLAAAYARSGQVQARVREEIARTRAAMGPATVATEAVAEAVEKPAYTEKQTDFLDKARAKKSDIYFEAGLLGKANSEREKAVMLRGLENEARRAGFELDSAAFELQREQLEIAMEYHEKQAQIAEVGAILGQGLADSFRAVTDAIIQSGDALEALRQVALNVLANIQNALVWKPVENIATGFFTSFIGNLVGGAAGGGAGGPISTSGIGAGSAVYPMHHAGGIAGSGGFSRWASPAAFISASRFHLGSDEVPSILQRGERVTSRAGVAAEGAMAGQMLATLTGILTAIRQERQMTITDYRPSAEQYVASKDGAKKIMYHVQRNTPDRQ
ncbi:MAG: phage tail tape measure protein [Planctomycetes bacterium RBG_13_60_9]|nr:MAG: phage tail tape measure protein [Planctomycetes bacterium RBG_13_60_9]